MIDINQIKLVIWDLDETLWKGVLSEGAVDMPDEHIQLIKDMVDCGVMNSICSKNDEHFVLDELARKGIKELFVFNSINWSPKGERVRQIVSEMNLRQPNVMFIDDNPSNRGEVKATCPEIDVEDVDVIPKLITAFRKDNKKDVGHKRLKQYKVLEKKQSFKANFASNEEFLKESNICVEIASDCNNHIERILDLINRSNQLNFTKVRLQKEELESLLNNPNVKCGYASVKDNFGDYGVVGFYAIENDEAKHFVFSCRTLGMGVEQYVYQQIGKPTLEVQGEVSSSPYEPDPYWINQRAYNHLANKDSLSAGKIVLKGPCDLSQLFAYINETKNIIQEFVYVGENGNSVEGFNHTTQIIESFTLTDKEKQDLIASCPFGDKEMFKTRIFDEDINYVVLSLFTDPNLGLYRNKESGLIVAFGEWTNNLLDESLWPSFINKELYVAGCSFSLETLKSFKNKYEFVGRLSPAEVLNNVQWIYNHMFKKTKLILTLGSEMAYESNNQPAYNDRHEYHKELNTLIKQAFSNNERVSFLDVNDFLKGQSDFTGNINHFTRRIYFELANSLIIKLNSDNSSLRIKSPSKRLLMLIKQEVAGFVKRVIRRGN